MFGRRFFGARMFGPRYFGDGGSDAPVVIPPIVRGARGTRLRKLVRWLRS
jgi:hypothetical protein